MVTLRSQNEDDIGYNVIIPLATKLCGYFVDGYTRNFGKLSVIVKAWMELIFRKICPGDHFLARWDDCPESYCHEPDVGISVIPQGKNFNLCYIF
jgi:hypothetical protein